MMNFRSHYGLSTKMFMLFAKRQMKAKILLDFLSSENNTMN